MPKMLIIYCIFMLNFIILLHGLSCKNEGSKDVDWFIVYKLPKIQDASPNSLFHEGKAYSYLSPNEDKWKSSSVEITSPKSMLGKTWEQLKAKENSATYLFYNDQPPDGFSIRANGYLKGMLAFDETSGFWLTHSIPKFGHMSSYEYPKAELSNGHQAWCFTFKTDQLDSIVEHLRFIKPSIYLRKITDTVSAVMKNENAKSLFTKNTNFVTFPPYEKISYLESKGGIKIIGFAKNNQLTKNLYNDMIAPNLNTPLFVRAGMPSPSFCGSKHAVTDITHIDITPWIGQTLTERKNISITSTEHTSNWAISSKSEEKYICIADLNRMASQAISHIGGGALCFKSTTAWQNFNDIIASHNKC